MWAAWYANLGVRVLPLSGKVPRISKIDGGNGVHDATTDGDLIREWWTRWPEANIGVALDGMAIIDVDPRHCGDEHFDRLLAAHHFDAGPCTLTGGGGMHWWMKAHPAIKTAPDQFGPGIDVKTDAGSYAVAPPSIHPSGTTYRWLPNYGPERPLPTLPESLVEELNLPKREAKTPLIPAAGKSNRYGEVALSNLVAEIETAPQGERHRTLIRSAIRAGELARDGHLNPMDGYAVLVAAGVRAYAGQRSEADIERTVADGMVKAVA